MAADYRQYPFSKGKHPAGWVDVTLGDIALEIRSGYSSGKHNKTGQGIPHLRPMNVSPVGEILMEDVRYVSPNVGGARLAHNDVLFTNTSSTAWVGKTALVEHPGDWGFSNHMTRLRVAEGMSSEFVARQLHYLCISGYFAFHCKKHINQSSVAGGQLTKDVPFRLPPSNEQQRIASKLRRLLIREQRLREELNALPALMQQYRASVLEDACSGRLARTEAELARDERREFEPASVLLERILVKRRAKWEADQLAEMRAAGKEPKGSKWREKYPVPHTPDPIKNFKLPKGWCFASAEQLTDASHPISYGVIKLGKDVAEGVPVLRSSNVRQLTLDLDTVKRISPAIAKAYQRTFLDGHEVLVTVRGTLGGVCALNGELSGYNVSREIAVLSLVEPSLGKTIAAFIASRSLSGWLMQRVTGVAQQGVNISDLRRLPIPLPPLREMVRIADEVERRLSILGRMEEQLKAAIVQTSALRASLFHRALAGELVMQDKADEPVDELLTRIRSQRETHAQSHTRTKTDLNIKMKKLSVQVVKEAITNLPKDCFYFEELNATLQADYDPLKDIIFELLGDSEPSLKQVFDLKEKTMKFQKIKR